MTGFASSRSSARFYKVLQCTPGSLQRLEGRRHRAAVMAWLLRLACVASVTAAATVEVKADAATAEVREIDFALISAAADGNATEVRRLLGKGADALAKTKEGETALHTAGIAGDAQVVELLVAAGADVHARVTAQRGLRMPPLAWFAYGLHLDGVRALQAAGADLNLVFDKEDGRQLTALDIASGIADAHELVAFLRAKGGKRFDELSSDEKRKFGARKS